MKWRASLCVVALLGGCAGGAGVGGPYEPLHTGYDETGMAGWYGAEFAGRKTANGEWFDPGGMTAAHRTLPFGSHVDVTAVASGRSVVLRINDRGPYHGKRIIDLSRAAAQRLGIAGVGRVRVRSVDAPVARMRPLKPIAAPLATGPGPFFVNVASFSGKARATALAERIDGDVIRAGELWRVRIGPFKGAAAANAARAGVVADGFGDATIHSAD